MSAAHVRRGGAGRAKRQEAAKVAVPKKFAKRLPVDQARANKIAGARLRAPSCSRSAAVVLVALDIPAKAERAAGDGGRPRGLHRQRLSDRRHQPHGPQRWSMRSSPTNCTALPTRPDRTRRPQALVDVAAIRGGCSPMAGSRTRASRGASRTRLVIDIVERKPAALWQNQGQLALIDADGVVLDRVPVDRDARPAAADRPRRQRPGAAAQRDHGRRPDAQAAARLGDLGRRPPLGSRTSSRARPSLFPKASDAAKAALIKFARADKQSGPARPGLRPLRPARARQDDRPPADALPASRSCRLRRQAAGGLDGPTSTDQPLIAALDIGSSKVSAMIARPDDEGG